MKWTCFLCLLAMMRWAAYSPWLLPAMMLWLDRSPKLGVKWPWVEISEIISQSESFLFLFFSSILSQWWKANTYMHTPPHTRTHTIIFAHVSGYSMQAHKINYTCSGLCYHLSLEGISIPSDPYIHLMPSMLSHVILKQKIVWLFFSGYLCYVVHQTLNF